MEKPRLTEDQFDQIVNALYRQLVIKPAGEITQPIVLPTDCVALLAFIEAAQEIYTRDCPIA
jgi:hypothetical protein